MVQEVEQTREEKIAMYMKSTKKQLAEMLVECNKYLRDKPIEICNLPDVVGSACTCDNLTKGEVIGWCSKHHTDFL